MNDAPALRVETTYLRKVNWSLLHAGMPLAWSLTLHNRGSRPAANAHLRLQLPDYLDTGPMPLPAIEPGATHRVDTARLPWIRRDIEAAMRLTDPRQTHLHLEVAGQAVQLPVGLQVPDEWCAAVSYNRGGCYSLDAAVELAEAACDLPAAGTVAPRHVERPWNGPWRLPAATAALVLPASPRVTQIKRHAAGLLDVIADRRQVPLEEWTGGSPRQKADVVRAVFAALTDLYPRAFHDIEKFGMDRRTQRVRFPEEALAGDGAARPGATCVDYALLLCAVLEACGLEPLFVLVGTGEGICHAMVGCWLEPPDRAHRRDVLLTSAGDVRQWLGEKDRLLVVDVTEFARGNSFRTACDLAGRRLEAPYQFCYALDIRAARARHEIAPLPYRPTAMPARPARLPRFVHLLRPARTFQERPELEAVRSFWRRAGRGGVLGVVGIGGAGKTALAERFLCELPGSCLVADPVRKRPDLPAPDGLFVWSFYESADCAEFLDELADYCRRSFTARPDRYRILPMDDWPWEDDASWWRQSRRAPGRYGKPREVLAGIQHCLAGEGLGRTLLVLDGMERVQKERGLRGQFTDDAAPVKSLLRWAAGGTQAVWVLATSRLPFPDLTDWKGRAYEVLNVEDLDPAAARALLRACGVRGTDGELEELTREFGRHALTLEHLGRTLCVFYEGDPAQALNLPPLDQVGGPIEVEAQALRLGRILAFNEATWRRWTSAF